MWVFTMMKTVNNKRATITIMPPKEMSDATINAAVKALNAVRNHPPTIVNTPVILYTALSLPQAPSLKDVPIATINVTYVVDRGSLNEVAIEIRILATTRFTDALTK